MEASHSMKPTDPLHLVRVLDLSHCRAGRWAAMLLGEQGADVIRVEFADTAQVQADEARLAAYADRGKRVWRLDHAADVDADAVASIGALVRGADVVLIDPSCDDALMAALAQHRHPQTVVVTFTGHGAGDAPPSDDALHAELGVFTDISMVAPTVGLPPTYTALPMASAYGAVHGAIGAMAGLIRRQRTGHGDAITVSLAGAVMAAMGSVMFRIEPQPTRYDIPPLPKAIQPLPAGVRWLSARSGKLVHRRLRQIGMAMFPPLMQFYRCADGAHIFILALDHRRFPVILLEALGLWDALRADGLQDRDPYAKGAGRQGDNIADAVMLSLRWKRRLGKVLRERFLQEPAAHWEQLLWTRGVPCAMVRSTQQWMREPAVRASGLVMQVNDPQCGPMWQAGTHVSLSGAAASPEPFARAWCDEAPVWRARPDLKLLTALPATQQALPLAGMKVLDLASMVAGPLCARTLAELGAEVIKIDPVLPLHGPRMTVWYAVEMSHGKQSVLLDFKQAAARQALEALARESDVVVHNMVGAAARSLEALVSSSGAVPCRVSAFAGPREGPWQERKGYDPVLQAATGVAIRFGTSEEPELHAIASCVDCLTGYFAAFGALCSLWTRPALPAGAAPPAVNASLAQAAQFIQSEFMALPRELPAASQGPWAVGRSALQRLYRTSDGWIWLAARHDQREALANLVQRQGQAQGLPIDDSHEAQGHCAQALAAALIRRPLDEWVTRFTRAGVSVMPVRSLAYWHQQPELQQLGALPFSLSHMPAHPSGSSVTRVRPSHVQSAYWSLVEGAPFPQPGHDTQAVLASVGLRPDEPGFAHAWSERYLPD